MSASAVIAAIKARLVADGRSVVLFRSIDASSEDADVLPVVGVYFGEEGEVTEVDGSLERRTVELDVVLVSEAADPDDAEIEAVVAAETLRDLLVQHKSDSVERYGGACNYAEVALMTVDTRPEHSSAIVSRVRIRAHY